MSELTTSFFNRLMQWEGGYQNHPQDTGNYNSCGQQVGTNFGITSKLIETLDGLKCPSEAFMRGLTRSDAFRLLQKNYRFWRCDEIEAPVLADLVFNCFMGLPTAAAKAVQTACNRFGAGLTVDGNMGSKTLAALNGLAAQNLPVIFNAVLDEWLAYLATTNPSFRQGLLNRTNALFSPMQANTSFPENFPEANQPEIQIATVRHTVQGAMKGQTRDLLWVGGFLAGLALLVLAAWGLANR